MTWRQLMLEILTEFPPDELDCVARLVIWDGDKCQRVKEVSLDYSGTEIGDEVDPNLYVPAKRHFLC
jgi:hypothetical protein